MSYVRISLGRVFQCRSTLWLVHNSIMKSALLAILIAAFGAAAYLQRPAPQLQLALVDLQGKHQNLGPLPISTFAPRISPSGKQLTFDTQENGPEVWIADFPSLGSR